MGAWFACCGCWLPAEMFAEPQSLRFQHARAGAMWLLLSKCRRQRAEGEQPSSIYK